MSVERNANEQLEGEPPSNVRSGRPSGQPIALVVDYEPLVRTLICSVLARLGWVTLEAGDGAEAMLVGPETIDLLITDYEMPGIKGIELADAFRSRVRDLAVVVVSGLETLSQWGSSRDYRFVAKPFDPTDLGSVVTGLQIRPSPEPRQGSAQAPGRYGSFSGWESRAKARNESDRPVGSRTCTLHCFPKGDSQFEADANKILAECTKTPTWAGILEQVRFRILQLYPGAAVYPRNLLAANGDPNEYWYCYRDGGLPRPRIDH